MRYWKRVGFAVSKGQALELIDRLADKPHGAVLDDDLEEFDSVGGDMSPVTLNREVEMLWERDFDPETDLQMDRQIEPVVNPPPPPPPPPPLVAVVPAPSTSSTSSTSFD